MKTYRHLFFDLDHTLWDFEQNAREAMQILFDDLQLEKLINVPFSEYHTAYIHHNEVMWSRYQKGYITRDELKWKRMWRTLLDFKITDVVLSKKIAADFLEILPTRKNLFPHGLEILQYLTEKNYQLHLITNGFEKTQWSKITNSNIHHFFTHVITSEASNSMKPKKEIFEFAMHKSGANLSNSIMIGDNLDADIAGALNAGMDAVFVNHINAVPDISPTFTVYHLKELEEIF